MASPCSPPCQLPPQPPVYPPPHHNLPSPPASDVQLLDYSSSPSPRRKTSPRSSHVPSQTSLHPEGAAFITSFQAPWDGAGRAGATTVKASSSATVGSKMDVATPSDHGWQVVHLKKWRKKLAAYPPPPPKAIARVMSAAGTPTTTQARFQRLNMRPRCPRSSKRALLAAASDALLQTTVSLIIVTHCVVFIVCVLATALDTTNDHLSFPPLKLK
jgi:hypothetical protein